MDEQHGTNARCRRRPLDSLRDSIPSQSNLGNFSTASFNADIG
jgi:hypothetical protein